MPSIKRTFTIPDDVSDKLDETISSKERSKFVATALRQGLKSYNKQKFLQMIDEKPKWKNETGQRSEDILKQIRAEREATIVPNS